MDSLERLLDEMHPPTDAASGDPVPRHATVGRRPLVFALLLLCFPVVAGNALSLSSVDVRSGILWLGSSGGGQVVAPSPFLNVWGVSLPLNFNSSIALVPEIDLFGTQYQLFGSRAIPTEIEFRSSVWLLNVIVDPAVRYQIRLSKSLTWGVELSPAFVFHIPTVSWDLTSQQIGQITGYFYSLGRFIYPEAGTSLSYQLLPNIGLEVRLRSFFPIFHLWDGEGLPFYDQLMVDGSIGLRFKIGK